MTQYAKGTEVSVAKSRAEIEILVTKYGATAFGSACDGAPAPILKLAGREG